MTNFTSRQIILNQTVGERLKKIREGSGLSLREISKKTGIKQEYLLSIESGQYSDLPGDIYCLEFIKTYARYLSIDEKQAAAEYYKERQVGRQSKKTSFWHNFSAWRVNTENIFTRASVNLVAGVVAIAAISGFLIFLSNSFSHEPDIEIFSPLAYYKSQNSRIVFSGRTNVGAEIFVNGQSVSMASTGDFNAVFNLPVGTNLLEISAVNKRGQERVVYRTIVVEPIVGQVAGASVERMTNNK